MTQLIADLPWLERAPFDYVERIAKLDSELSDRLGPALSELARYYLTPQRLEKLGKRILSCQVKSCDFTPLVTVRLGLVTNSTTDFLAHALRATAPRYGLNLELTVADFDQAMQEAFDPQSPVNTARPDAVLLALDHRGLPLEQSAGTPSNSIAQAAADHLKVLRDSFAKHSGAQMILQTVPRPAESLFGGLDRRTAGTWADVTTKLNSEIDALAVETGDLVLDAAGLSETIGLAAWHDAARWHSAKIPFSLDLLPIYCDHVCRLIAAWKGKSRKCLVLDLDNTLWGGVIGDDGLDGIAIGQGDSAGEAFLAIQKTAKALSQRGIVLAVCSKNDEANAREPFQKHPEMVLKESDFAAFVANWTDKASNIRAIAKSLNLGLDSFVFLDDNPVERGQVRSVLPEVAVPELPDDPAQYPAMLMQAGYFEAVTFTTEDRTRASQYQSNLERDALKVEGQSIEEYLRSLDMTIQIKPFDQMGRGRIEQLINKTNQFNLTTKRCDAAEVREYEESPAFYTAQVRVTDRFGDNGMIGVVVAEKTDKTWDIPIWLMSCRVLNRRVEEAVLNGIAAAARADGATELIGRYIASPKNAMVKDLYGRLGFERVREDAGGTQTWRLDLESYTPKDVPFKNV
jgi:FkbH-like protein